MELPNLAGVATQDLVEQIGGSFKASYINWARTMHLLRVHAPGWLPVLGTVKDSTEVVHHAPNGGYLMIAFDNGEHVTPFMPQAIMDTHNKAIPFDKITARDITDTHRRGVCMAASMTFGLAYELWAKMPLESGYEQEEPSQGGVTTHAIHEAGVHPTGGVLESLSPQERDRAQKIATTALEYFEAKDVAGAYAYLTERAFGDDDGAEMKSAVKTFFPKDFLKALKALSEQPTRRAA